MAKLPEFDIRDVDLLVDRAKAAWYAVITNMPAAEAQDYEDMLAECIALRTKFLVWLPALVHADEALGVNLLDMTFLSRVRFSHERGKLILEQ